MKATLKSRPRGPFPMALEGFAFGLGVFAAVLIAALSLTLWRLLARRFPRASWAVPVVGALLVVGCFVPTPRLHVVETLEGSLTGSAWIPVTAGASATAQATGGSATLSRLDNGTWLVLDCPAGCTLRAGTRADAPDASLGLDFARADAASVHGEARLVHAATSCQRLPFVTGLAMGRADCVPCADVVLESGEDGLLHGGSRPTC